MGDTYKAELCDCCLMVAINDDDSGHMMCDERDPYPMSEFPDGHVVRGTVDEVMGEDYEPVVHEFSRVACDGCGEWRAGRRSEVHVEIMVL